jgi:hypothetical protein
MPFIFLLRVRSLNLHAFCAESARKITSRIEFVDVAGLVKGAHAGHGSCALNLLFSAFFFHIIVSQVWEINFWEIFEKFQ